MLLKTIFYGWQIISIDPVRIVSDFVLFRKLFGTQFASLSFCLLVVMPLLAADPPKDAIERLDPPGNKERLEKARQTVLKMFAKDFDQATTPTNKRKLAQELLENAPRIKDDPEVRYAMLTEARDLAIAAGRVAMAEDAIDLAAKYYRLDPTELKIAALEKLSKSARDTAVQREIAIAANALGKNASQAGRFDDAERLVLLALLSARKTQNAQLIRETNATMLEIAAAKKKAKK